MRIDKMVGIRQQEKMPVLLPFLVLIVPIGVFVLKLTPRLLRFTCEFPTLNLPFDMIPSIANHEPSKMQ